MSHEIPTPSSIALSALTLLGASACGEAAPSTLYTGSQGPDSTPEHGGSDASETMDGTMDGAMDGDSTGSDADESGFDLQLEPDLIDPGCEDLSLEFSYIWIANSPQGTISKIDTQSLIEVGRYRSRPDGGGSPSRTSVNLAGDVAVANRSGGVTKIFANPQDCQEQNGEPDLQTSTGADDVLAWGYEECVAWHTAFTYDSQRPVAWTRGKPNGDCTWSDARVWTTGTSGDGGWADVILLDGDDGSIVDKITVEGLSPGNTFGGYGAVVDPDGNLWFNEMLAVGDYLVRVDVDDLSYELIDAGGRSGYGIAVDASGRILTCGANKIARYDPETETWTSRQSAHNLGGCMVDSQGRLWTGGDSGFDHTLDAFDVDSLLPVLSFDVPAHLHGISIDFDGYVWGVPNEPGDRAYRFDPDTGDYAEVLGLVGAYTYSDMTGFALANIQ